MTRRALVIGGSLGGLFAANLLARAGWQVDVYEKTGEALAARGAGLATHPELMRALERAGATLDESIGVRVRRRVALARDGSVAGTRDLPQVMTAWSRVYRLLKDVFPADRYHFGRGVARVESRGDRVVATFEDGRREEGNLLVAADGIRSTVRMQLAPDVRPQYAGYVAWRGLIEERAFPPAIRDEIFEDFVFGLPPGEQIVTYPVAGRDNTTRPGERRYNFVWYRPADEDDRLAWLLTDVNGTQHEGQIPPHLIRPEVIAAMRRDAGAILAPQIAAVIELTEAPFIQPIFDLESPQLAFGRVATLGDAAFVARPHVGMGVLKAGDDALALVDRLVAHGDDVEAAVAAYERDRQPYGMKVIARARHLGAYLQAQIRSDAERAMAERYRTVEAVLRETAVSPGEIEGLH
ncbi:MAG TPA: FAD binding domain-containing protein [Burkholderiales bacterium]|nr:FAD binding domain-containing protein [Burkholderiales bacterium]